MQCHIMACEPKPKWHGAWLPFPAVPVVDIVLGLLVVLGALYGLRMGAVVQLFTFGGFWLGLTLGALLAAAIVPAVTSLPLQAALSLAALLGLAFFLASVGHLIGSRSSLAVRRYHLGGVDSAFGVVVSMAAVLVSAWLVGNVLAQSRFTPVSTAIQRSHILGAVDGVLPPVPSVFSRIDAFLQSEGFPPAFAELGPPTWSSVPTPTSAQAEAIGSAVARSTVKVLGVACGEEQEGTGFVVAPGMVVTNAHVVAGEQGTQVYVDDVGYSATPVYFDPDYDIAVLRTDAPLGPSLALDAGTVARGTQGAVVGYPEDGPLTAAPAGVAGPITAAGRNIYNDSLVTRDIYQLDADVEPGNSGSPVVTSSGTVIGVVFSRSTIDQGVGYALTSPGVLSRVQQAEARTAGVSTGACVHG